MRFIVLLALFLAAAPLAGERPAARGVELFPLPALGGAEVVATPDGSAWTVGAGFRGERSVLYELTPAGQLVEVQTAIEPGWQLTYGPGDAIWIGDGDLIRFDPLTRTSIVVKTGLFYDVELREGPDGNLWIVGAFGNYDRQTWAVVRVAPDGRVLDALPIPRRMNSVATAAGMFWMTPGWPLDDHALYAMTPTGAITRYPLPFMPRAVFAGPDMLWVSGVKYADGAVIVSFDGRVLSREPAGGAVDEATVDHQGNLWFADDQSLVRLRRGALPLRYTLPRLPDATCWPSDWLRPIVFTAPDTLTMTANYQTCSGPCPPYDPCVANPPPGFLLRADLEAMRQPRRRSVGK